MSAVTLPVDNVDPDEDENRKSRRFAFLSGLSGERRLNLANLLRSSYVAGDGVMAGPRSPRDRTAHAHGAEERFRLSRRVILTILSVNGRYFGRVTASVGR